MRRPPARRPPAAPWGTLALGAATGLAWVFRTATGALIYERSALLHGEIWRAWTGHLVHYGISHVFWNLLVFLPAGCWLERLWPVPTRRFYLFCPPFISATLLGLDPALIRYAGLSGLAAGMLVLLACLQLRRPDEPAWIWLGVLALVGTKITAEWLTGAPLLVHGIAGFHPVPLAHLGGAVGGLAFALRPVGGGPPG